MTDSPHTNAAAQVPTQPARRPAKLIPESTPESTPPSAPTSAAASTDPKRWTALIVISLAQLMVILDGTIVNIALPRMQTDLGFTDGTRQWVVTAYSLAFGGLLLLGGRLGDLLGRKRIFLIGLIGFALASVLGGIAPGIGVLLAARALQGAFGALLAPAALSLVATTFTQGRERATAFGIFSAIAMAGSAIGLLLGGVLTECASWRWCLLINVVFAIAAVIGAPAIRDAARSGGGQRLDVPGAVLATGGVLALVYGFASAESSSWTSTLTIVMFVLAVVLLVAFVVVESRVKAPLLPLRVVTDRNRAGIYLGVGLVMIANFAQFLFLAYYLQQVKGFSPLLSGMAFMPMTVFLTIGTTQVGARLALRTAPRTLLVGGFLLTALSMALLAQLQVDSSYWVIIVPAHVILGIGLGAAFSAALNLGTYGVRPEDAGAASAMVNTSQQVGGAVGTALLNTIAAGATAGWLASRAGATTGVDSQLEAAVHGYTTAFWWSAAIVVLAAVIVGVCVNAKPQRDEASAGDAPIAVH